MAKKSFLRSAYNAVVDARTRQAHAYVNRFKASHDDATLQAAGLDRGDVRPSKNSYFLY